MREEVRGEGARADPARRRYASRGAARWRRQRRCSCHAVIRCDGDAVAHGRDVQHQGHPVVLAGDYNVIPTDEDVYNPKSWQRDALNQPEARERYRRLLAQGWVDALRELHPDERIYTFWDYFRDHWKRNAGLRIDHLLLNPPTAARLIDADVDSWVRGEEKASDHAPTWIKLAAEGANKKPARSRKKLRT